MIAQLAPKHVQSKDAFKYILVTSLDKLLEATELESPHNSGAMFYPVMAKFRRVCVKEMSA